MVCALGNGTHMLHFGRIDHIRAFLSHMKSPKVVLFVTFEVIYRMYYIGKRLTCQGISLHSKHLYKPAPVSTQKQLFAGEPSSLPCEVFAFPVKS